MIRILLLPLLIALSSLLAAQEPGPREFPIKEGDTTYIMKKYVFCMLKKGPNRQQDSTLTAEIQKGHLAHIDALAKRGKVLLAGPFGEDSEARGILVFDVATVEEAKALQAEDPAMKAGRLVADFHTWWTAKGGTLK